MVASAAVVVALTIYSWKQPPLLTGDTVRTVVSIAANSGTDEFRPYHCVTGRQFSSFDSVQVPDGDRTRQELMGKLVRVGLYERGERMVAHIPGMRMPIEYHKTARGKDMTNSDGVCVSKGVAVDEVPSISEPEWIGGSYVATAKVTYRLVAPVHAMTNEELWDGLLPEYGTAHDVGLVYGDNGEWQWISRYDLEKLKRQNKYRVL